MTERYEINKHANKIVINIHSNDLILEPEDRYIMYSCR